MLMLDSKMSNRILKLLAKQYEATELDLDFVELTHRVDGFGGDCMWMLDENLTAWPSLSETAVNVMQDLLTERRIKLRQVAHTYYVDRGVTSTLRLSASVRPCGVLTWLPCTVGEGPQK